MKLSIVTINYNNAIGLERTIQSITCLKSSDIEYIVIDGASTDNSILVIDKYSEKINHHISEPDKGIYNAMNKGIKYASGDYLLFMNSGDIINEIDISEVIEQLQSNEDIICFDIKVQSPDNPNDYFIREAPDNPDFRFFTEWALQHQATIIKRSLLVEYGGYSENIKISADWAFTIDMICKTQCSYKHIKSYFATFYTDGISSRPESEKQVFKERKDYIKANYTPFLSMYKDWENQRAELHKLRMAKSIRLIKKTGFLRWFKIY